jgi:hypothetical protein
MISKKDTKFDDKELKSKLAVLRRQIESLTKEIDEYVILAIKTKVCFKDDKLKLYNARADMGRIPQTKRLGEAISGLANKNLELWHLEDEARRKDVGLDYIGGIKRKIDLANQKRNDFMDKIDELFDRKIKGLK